LYSQLAEPAPTHLRWLGSLSVFAASRHDSWMLPQSHTMEGSLQSDAGIDPEVEAIEPLSRHNLLNDKGIKPTQCGKEQDQQPMSPKVTMPARFAPPRVADCSPTTDQKAG
jgi:hypothetical protein